MEIYNEIKRKLQAFTTEIYEHIIENRFKNRSKTWLCFR